MVSVRYHCTLAHIHAPVCVCVCVCVCVEQPEESVRNFTACRDHTIEESELRAITRTATLLSVFAGGLLASGFSSD